MKKIDIHCHTSPRVIKDTVDGKADIMSIRKRMIIHGIARTVLLATYFPHKGTGISNYRLLKWVSEHSDLWMMVSLDFEHYYYQGLNEIEELADNDQVVGIKIYTCYQEIDVSSKRFRQVMKIAQQHGLLVMFHTGYSYSSVRKYGRDTIARPYSAYLLEPVAQRFPDVPIIMSHMSKPFFHEMVEVARRNKNVYTDMSGIIDSKFDEAEIPVCVQEIRTFVGKCGAEKLLFGTDFPVQTYEHSIRFIEEAFPDDEETKKKIYYENAVGLIQ